MAIPTGSVSSMAAGAGRGPAGRLSAIRDSATDWCCLGNRKGDACALAMDAREGDHKWPVWTNMVTTLDVACRPGGANHMRPSQGGVGGNP